MASPVEAIHSINAAKYIAAGICMGIGGIGSALAQGFIGGKACESIAQRPESAGAVRGTAFTAMIFSETATMFSLIVSLLLLAM